MPDPKNNKPKETAPELKPTSPEQRLPKENPNFDALRHDGFDPAAKYFIVAQYEGNAGKPPFTKQVAKLPKFKNYKNDILEASVYLINPRGVILGKFDANSGGYGLGAIPGLTSDIDNDPTNKKNAEYPIYGWKYDTKVEDKNNSGYHFSNSKVKGESKGYMVRLVSPDYVGNRGLNAEQIANPKNQGAFGIHPDGKAKGNFTTRANDGTQGCLGIHVDQAEEFITMLNRISPDKRPESVIIIDRSQNIKDICKDIKQYNQDIVFLRLRESPEVREMLEKTKDMMQMKSDRPTTYRPLPIIDKEALHKKPAPALNH